MKTKTIGSYAYFVTKYFIDKDGSLNSVISRWSKAKYAFEDAENHRARHGKDMAFVFKGKQCIKVD